MRKIFIVAVFIVTGIGHQSLFRLVQGLKKTDTQSAAVESLDLAGLLQLRGMRSTILFDIRSKWQYDAGHIEKARSLPYEAAGKLLDEKFETIKKHQAVVLYCDSSACATVYKTGHHLKKLGIETIYVYAGGFSEWKACGLPVENGDADS